MIDNILNFENKKIEHTIINDVQVKWLVQHLLEAIKNNIDGDVVEMGCYVGESSKFLMKTLVETKVSKQLYVYDSFDGLPELSKWENGTGWRAGTLKTTEEVLISNFKNNNLPLPIIHKDWFKDIPDFKIPDKISFAFLDGDFYDSIYDSLTKIFDKLTDGGYICFHDYNRNDLPGVKAAVDAFFTERGIPYKVDEVCEQLGVYRKNTHEGYSKHFATNFKENITKEIDLDKNDGLSSFMGLPAQQNHNVYEVFYNFIKDTKPKRILEIGAGLGGFTHFMKKTAESLNLNVDILSYDTHHFSWYDELTKCGVDMRVENIFDKDYKDVKEEVIKYIQKEGVTIVLCDGGNKIGEFNLLSNYIKPGDFIMAHDYIDNSNNFNENYYGKIWNWHEISDADILDASIKNNLEPYNKELFDSVVWVCKKKQGNGNTKTYDKINVVKKTTLVTGLWDLGRDNLSEGWNRSFEHYLNKFEELLKIDNNLIIFGDENLKKFTFERRKPENTQFILRSKDWFKNNDYFEKIQNIRNNPDWYNQVGWLTDSTQAKLEYYNPLVMSKMFLLNDAKIMDSFDSDYLFWVDAGITNTVHYGYFTHDKVINKLHNYVNNFLFVAFPYEANTEIHGFDYNAINRIAENKITKVARGGFFGGRKETISDVNSMYYNLLTSTLNEGLMGTEESLFSIMMYKNPELFDYAEIEYNGLVSKFFEDLKNDELKLKTESKFVSNVDVNNVALYVITFNSPKQFKVLIESMLEYDPDFITKPKKYLLDNSTDLSTTPEYLELCEKYDFEHIKKDNLGIVRGRVFISEHFQESNHDVQIFFEDDMAFFNKNNKEQVCRNGFNRYVPNLYKKSLEILKKENFDFLKLNFTEFYGSNDIQFSWYNVPQEFREKKWPENPKLPEFGLDPNAPNTLFKHIKVHQGIPYATGEVYICNWPILLTKEGNYKCYLETQFAHPHEQTLMSYVFQETIKGRINPGILLLTPTEHNRFDFYEGSLRKEC